MKDFIVQKTLYFRTARYILDILTQQKQHLQTLTPSVHWTRLLQLLRKKYLQPLPSGVGELQVIGTTFIIIAYHQKQVITYQLSESAKKKAMSCIPSIIPIIISPINLYILLSTPPNITLVIYVKYTTLTQYEIQKLTDDKPLYDVHCQQ